MTIPTDEAARAQPRPTNVLDDALERLGTLDPSLAAILRREVDELRDGRKFGLVFNRHLPESVRLPSHPVKRGVKVALRNPQAASKTERDATWRVTKVETVDGKRVAWLHGVEEPRLASDLVAIRDFGEPVYPGLKSVERIERGGDVPFHTVINGENYHALQALRFTHRDAVDLIYIDPPYNTGGKSSWLYNDKYVDTVSGDASSKWLSFMERRLAIAHELLKDTGAIMISIGDDEQHRLRMLMDQVFGPQNFVTMLTVEMSTTSGPKTVNAQQGTIVKNCEWVLIYRKTAAFDTDVAHTPLYDGVDGWAPNYTVWLNGDGTVGSLADALVADDVVRAEIERSGLLKRGKFSMKDMDALLGGSSVVWDFVFANVDRIARTDRLPVSCRGLCPPNGQWKRIGVGGRDYLLTTLPSGTEVQIMPLSMNFRTSDDHKPRYGRTVIRGDLWKFFYKDMARVDQEGGVPFPNGKKPLRLIKQLIRWANNSPDAVILDFFGGSGTTAEAVMRLNAEDNGRRRAILVTNNELGRDEAKKATAAGHVPGDPQWEARGVFAAVTRPRLTTVVTGVRPDGSTYSDGLDANVEFFEMTYLDEARISRAREFEAIAPLLWMQTGASGERIATEPETGWALTEHYGVLFTEDATRPFLKALAEQALAAEAAPTHVFVVTDSDAHYTDVAGRLPAGAKAARLYESYLKNFEINVEVGQ